MIHYIDAEGKDFSFHFFSFFDLQNRVNVLALPARSCMPVCFLLFPVASLERGLTAEL